MATETSGTHSPSGHNVVRDVVERHAVARDRTALSVVGSDVVVERHTFGGLAAAAARWAHLLRGNGLQPGAAVLVATPNPADWVAATLGALKGGLVPVPCPTRLRVDEVAGRTHATGSSFVVATADDADALRAVLDPEITVLGLDRAADILPRCADTAPTQDRAPGDPALVLFTRGITGAPRPVVHTTESLRAAAAHAHHWLDTAPGDVVWCSPALGEALTVWSTILGPWGCGAAVVAAPDTRDPAARIELLEALQVSVIAQTPDDYAAMARVLVERSRPLGIRRAASTGSPLVTAGVEAFSATTRHTVHDGYWQTECGLVMADSGPRRPHGSLGWPVPGSDIAVLDADGAPAPDGTVGDLAVACTSPSLYAGYGTQTRAAGRWHLTGDRVVRLGDGSYGFVARAAAATRIIDGRTAAAQTADPHDALLAGAATGSTQPFAKPSRRASWARRRAEATARRQAEREARDEANRRAAEERRTRDEEAARARAEQEQRDAEARDEANRRATEERRARNEEAARARAEQEQRDAEARRRALEEAEREEEARLHAEREALELAAAQAVEREVRVTDPRSEPPPEPASEPSHASKPERAPVLLVVPPPAEAGRPVAAQPAGASATDSLVEPAPRERVATPVLTPPARDAAPADDAGSAAADDEDGERASGLVERLAAYGLDRDPPQR